jgi:lysozyme
MMRLGAKGEALIKSFEKLRLVAYKPTPKDKWTIGWGHTGPEVVEGLTCTEEEAERWFLTDTHWAVLGVIRSLDVAVLQNQFDALVSFTFNVGITGEAHSTLISHVNQYHWDAAADEFLKWDHQDGKVVEGLLNRRKAERTLFLEV